MLINGNIDSYVNFFYLTHSTENQNESINNVINSNKNKENEDYEKEERKYFEIKTYNEDNYNEDNINKGKSISVDNLYNFNSLFVGIEECERLGKYQQLIILNNFLYYIYIYIYIFFFFEIKWMIISMINHY